MEYSKYYLLFTILIVVESARIESDEDIKVKNPLIDFFGSSLKAFRTKPGETIAVFDPQILKSPNISNINSWFRTPANLGAAAANTLTDWLKRNSDSLTTSTTTTTPEPPIIINFHGDEESKQGENTEKRKKKKKVKSVPKNKSSKRRIHFDDDESFDDYELVRPLKKKRRVVYDDDYNDDYYYDDQFSYYPPHRNHYFHDDEDDYYMDDFGYIPIRPVYERPLKRHTSSRPSYHSQRNPNRRRRPSRPGRPHNNHYDPSDYLTQSDDFLKPFSDLPEETRPVKFDKKRKQQQQQTLSDPQLSLVIPVQAVPSSLIQTLEDPTQSQQPHKKYSKPMISYEDAQHESSNPSYQTAVAFLPIPVEKLNLKGPSLPLSSMQIIAQHTHTFQTQPSQTNVFQPHVNKQQEHSIYHEETSSYKPSKKPQKMQGYYESGLNQKPPVYGEQPPRPMRNPFGLTLTGTDDEHKDKIQSNKEISQKNDKETIENDPHKPNANESHKEEEISDQDNNDDDNKEYITVGEEPNILQSKKIEARSHYYIPQIDLNSLLAVNNNGRFLLKTVRRMRTMNTEEETNEENMGKMMNEEKSDEDEMENNSENKTFDANLEEGNNDTNGEMEGESEISKIANKNDDENDEGDTKQYEQEEETEEANEDDVNENEEEQEDDENENEEEQDDDAKKREISEIVDETSSDSIGIKKEHVQNENPEAITQVSFNPEIIDNEDKVEVKINTQTVNTTSSIPVYSNKVEHHRKPIIRSEVVHEKPNGHFIIKTDTNTASTDNLKIESLRHRESKMYPKLGLTIINGSRTDNLSN